MSALRANSNFRAPELLGSVKKELCRLRRLAYFDALAAGIGVFRPDPDEALLDGPDVADEATVLVQYLEHWRQVVARNPPAPCR